MPGRYSKRQVSRAGEHLASRLHELRATSRPSLVNETDAEDVLAREVVNWWRDQHLGPMLDVHDAVAELAPPMMLDDEVVHAVGSRLKRFPAIIDKLTREPGKLADMVDLGGVRAVVETQDEVDWLRGQLETRVDVRRVRDWARSPRASGYRAVHLHVRRDRYLVEVQLRTFGQDAWANLVEEEGRVSGHDYKSGRGPAEVLAFFRLVADLTASVELGETHPDIASRMAVALHEARPHLTARTFKRLGS